MIKLKRGTFQHVESELYAYHDTCQEIVRIKNEILYGKSSDDENVGGGKSNLHGDPTGKTATLLATHKKLEQLQVIANAIQTTYNGLPSDLKQLVELRYWVRPQTLNWDGVALKIGVSRRQAIRWRDGIVYAVSEKLGWR